MKDNILNSNDSFFYDCIDEHQRKEKQEWIKERISGLANTICSEIRQTGLYHDNMHYSSYSILYNVGYQLFGEELKEQILTILATKRIRINNEVSIGEFSLIDITVNDFCSMTSTLSLKNDDGSACFGKQYINGLPKQHGGVILVRGWNGFDKLNKDMTLQEQENIIRSILENWTLVFVTDKSDSLPNFVDSHYLIGKGIHPLCMFGMKTSQ